MRYTENQGSTRHRGRHVEDTRRCKGTLRNIEKPCTNGAQANGLCAYCEREAVDAMHQALRQYGQHRLAGELEIEYYFRKEVEK